MDDHHRTEELEGPPPFAPYVISMVRDPDGELRVARHHSLVFTAEVELAKVLMPEPSQPLLADMTIDIGPLQVSARIQTHPPSSHIICTCPACEEERTYG